MNAPVNRDAVLAALRQENDELREVVRQLREELAPVRAFPKAWRLTPQQETVLSCIMAASPGLATYRRILSAIYEHREPPDSADQMLGVMVHGVRKRLRAAGVEPGLRCITGRGYVMSDAARERLLAVPEGGEPTEPAWWAEARRMRANGATYRQIGRTCGKNEATVYRALNDAYRAKDSERVLREMRLARAALKSAAIKEANHG